VVDHLIWLAVAAVLAGAGNAIAGGGALVSFLAMVAAGLPPSAANATNLVMLPAGFLGAVAGRGTRRTDPRPVPAGPVRPDPDRPPSAPGGEWTPLTALAGCVGTVLGACAVAFGPPTGFRAAAPWLVLAAAALIAGGPVLNGAVSRLRSARADDRRRSGRSLVPVVTPAVMLGVGGYCGYFGAAAGIIILAALGLFTRMPLHSANALKNRLALVFSTLGAVVLIGAAAPIDWVLLAVLAPGAALGGAVGVRLARFVPPDPLRWAIVALATVGAAAMLLGAGT
jgi:hypothetical protein